jgi:hypothetical protein
MSWFDKCLTTHVRCNVNCNYPAWYPTRLLDLGILGNSHHSVRLIHSAEEAMSGSYVTLSHCWGRSQFIQLNRNVSSALRSGISVDDLPKTFRDAIFITRRLGVRYIWIDSMCIQQVSKHQPASLQTAKTDSVSPCDRTIDPTGSRRRVSRPRARHLR